MGSRRVLARLPSLLAGWLVLCGTSGCGAPAAEDARPEVRPDVLLVVLDTVRADRLSTYGHHRPTSPRLDALAGLGVVFEDVTAAAPWTWPSHASIFTGEPPWVHGARTARPHEDGAGDIERFGMQVEPLRADLPTLAERFREAGYRTHALVVNDWLHPELGLLRGFEHTRSFDRDAALFDAAARVLDSDDPRPLFLFVNAMTAHSPFRDGPGAWALPDRDFLDPSHSPAWVRPYLTPDLPRGVHLSEVDAPGRPSGVIRHSTGDLVIPPPDMEKLLALYDAGVAGADYVLGRLLDAWIDSRREGVVAVTSDHGEGFGEHGLLDHRGTVYPEVLRVPLVIAAPGRLPAGVRVDAPVSLLSLHDTLLDLANLSQAGSSLVPVVEGAEAPTPIVAMAGADPVWAAHAGSHFADDWRLLRRGDFALVHRPGGGEASLYDLSRDPGMLRDLAPEQPERVARLRDEASSHFVRWERKPDDEANTALAIPDDVAERLRRLGYAAPSERAAPSTPP